jgi:hypothetical protein
MTAAVAVLPAVGQLRKDGREPGVPLSDKKTEKQKILEPRAMKTPLGSREPKATLPASQPAGPAETIVAKAEEVSPVAVAKKSEPIKKPAPEAKEEKVAVALKPVLPEQRAAVTLPVVQPAVQTQKTVALDMQPGLRIAPQLLVRSGVDQVVAFSKALEKDNIARQRLVLPEFKNGVELAAFKKIQEMRREEITGSAKIDTQPADAERPIVPYFKEKRLASPQ